MDKPNFNQESIRQRADELLPALYFLTKGDEWKGASVKEVYQIAGFQQEMYENEPYRNNILQFLVYQGFITVNDTHETIKITHEGKNYLYKNHPDVN
jgi:hypothetical protein